MKRLGLLVAGMLSATAAIAEPPNGQLLAAQCGQCHGIPTNTTVKGFENLRGESANEIYNELLEFRAKNPANDIMARQARGYTLDELFAIAQYLGSR